MSPPPPPPLSPGPRSQLLSLCCPARCRFTACSPRAAVRRLLGVDIGKTQKSRLDLIAQVMSGRQLRGPSTYRPGLIHRPPPCHSSAAPATAAPPPLLCGRSGSRGSGGVTVSHAAHGLSGPKLLCFASMKQHCKFADPRNIDTIVLSINEVGHNAKTILRVSI